MRRSRTWWINPALLTVLTVSCSSTPSETGETALAGDSDLTPRHGKDAGSSSKDAGVDATADAAVEAASSALPPPWVDGDVGSPGAAGSATYSGGAFTVAGAGADIWGTSDVFDFVHETQSGDFTIAADVRSLSDTSAWAKAGVMIRQSLDASSPFAFAALWPASGAFLEWRAAQGAGASNGTVVTISPPQWVKLARQGSTFTAYASADGASWTSLGSTTIAMADPVYVGLAVTSHADPTLATAVFSGVEVTATGSSTSDGGTDAMPSQDSGAPTSSKIAVGIFAPGSPMGADMTGSAIPWSLYTHLVHFAAAPNADGTINDNYLAPSEIAEFVASRPAGKKAIVTLLDTGNMATATSPGTIAAFVTNIVGFVQTNGYDGVDIDWESNIVVSQFDDLLARLRSALPPGAIITADVSGGDHVTIAHDEQSVTDWFNVMCYDLGWWGPSGTDSSVSWHDDALHQGGDNVMTCDWRVAPFTSAGVASSKLAIGIPFYGGRWAGVTQPAQSGATSHSVFSYRDLVQDTTRWQSGYVQWDSKHAADYLSIPGLNEFDSYNGARSIQETVNWINQGGFIGAMTFNLQYEYLPTQTGDARYPLSAALYGAMHP